MSQFDLSTTNLQVCESIISEHERQLYQLLIENLDKFYPNQYVICPKVRIGDIITMEEKKFNFSLRQRYKSRHFDFLICSKDNLKPILAIELQDNTHKTKKAKYIDILKSKLCEHANLNFLQLWTLNPTHIQQLLYHRL